MFGFIKKLFYKEECYNCKTDISKLKCVRNNMKITPYSKEYRNLNLGFLHNNIMEAIVEINDLKSGIIQDNISVKRITQSMIKEKYINKWFTDNEFSIMENTDDIWYEYLDLNIWLLEWYITNNVIGSKYYSYTLKIKPYIININNIVDNIIKFQDKSL